MNRGRGAKLDRAEWDFSAVKQAELLACVEWEFPRSVPACRAAVGRLRERFKSSFSGDDGFDRDPATIMCDYCEFEEWPEVRFTELPTGRRQEFRVVALNDEGMPRDLGTAIEMEEGTSILLDQFKLLFAYVEKVGAKRALEFATKYYRNDLRPPSDRTDECLMLNIDLGKSNDSLVAGFVTLITSLRKKRGIKIKELRGASNVLSQARTKLNQLAAARLLRAMSWQDAYVETLGVSGTGLYADRPEDWRRAAEKGESMLERWEQEVAYF